MGKKVFERYQDLNPLDLPRNEDGLLLFDEDTINYHSRITRDLININGKPYYFKTENDYLSANEIAISRMYNDDSIGMYTPPADLIVFPKNKYCNTYLITQDVASAYPNDEVMIARQSGLGVYFSNKPFKWELVFSKECRDSLLQYMTPYCLEKLETMLALDELHTEGDRKDDNFILVKSKESGLFIDVVPIDNELSLICKIAPQNSREFEGFLDYAYFSKNPFNCNDFKSYRNRINTIRDMIQNGSLSDNQVRTIHSAITFNLPETIKVTCENPLHKKYQDTLYTSYSYLWKFLQNTLGRDLGM